MKLEDIKLSETSQSQKGKYTYDPIYRRCLGSLTFMESERTVGVARV